MRNSFPKTIFAILAFLTLSSDHNPHAAFQPHYVQIQPLNNLERRQDVNDSATPPNLLPGAIAVAPLPHNMNLTFLFTQYPDHVSYTAYFSPGGFEYWNSGLCLGWAVGLPELYFSGSAQCAFPGSDQCLPTDNLPNPCTTGQTFLTTKCNPIETVSENIPLQQTRFTTTTALLTINSTYSTVSPSSKSSNGYLIGHSVLVVYWAAPINQTVGNTVVSDITTVAIGCATVLGGNGTIGQFDVTNTGQEVNGTSGVFGPVNGTLNIVNNNGATAWRGGAGWAVAVAVLVLTGLLA